MAWWHEKLAIPALTMQNQWVLVFHKQGNDLWVENFPGTDYGQHMEPHKMGIPIIKIIQSHVDHFPKLDENFQPVVNQALNSDSPSCLMKHYALVCQSVLSSCPHFCANLLIGNIRVNCHISWTSELLTERRYTNHFQTPSNHYFTLSAVYTILHSKTHHLSSTVCRKHTYTPHFKTCHNKLLNKTSELAINICTVYTVQHEIKFPYPHCYHITAGAPFTNMV